MKRYECLQAIAPAFTDEIVVGSVGGVRPAWHSLWGHGTHFYMVNMGMASSIALGLALQLPHRRVVVFDGDCSLLFNLGCLATIGYEGINLGATPVMNNNIKAGRSKIMGHG